jgi:hypothetical protein
MSFGLAQPLQLMGLPERLSSLVPELYSQLGDQTVLTSDTSLWLLS